MAPVGEVVGRAERGQTMCTVVIRFSGARCFRDISVVVFFFFASVWDLYSLLCTVISSLQ